MTAPLLRPKRRSLWIGLAASIVVLTLVWTVLDVRRKNSAEAAWLTEASRRHLVVQQDHIVFGVPGGMYIGPGKIQVTVKDHADVETLLAMPPCPTRVKVTPLFLLSSAEIDSLQSRFGPDVVGDMRVLHQ